MPTQNATLNDCIESLRLHVCALQRAGIRFDAALRDLDPARQASRADRLATLSTDSAACRRCRLCSGRTHVVFGEGNAEARLMFVGDSPDSDSDAQARPFAGASGQLLTRIIEAIRMQRSQVYLTCAVKCLTPPDDTGEDAIAACLPILQQQIEIIQPEIICALGPVAARVLQGPGAGNAPERGRFFRRGSALVMPTHHPELLLHRPELKNETWIDVQIIQRELETHLPRIR